MKIISKKIMQIICQQGIISNSELDKYIYGLEIFLSSTVEVISIILLSAILGNVVQTILFFSAFIPLRIFAGGYHADTRLRCYLVSLMVYAIFTALIGYIPYTMRFHMIVGGVLFTLIVVCEFAPVINANKKLNTNEVNTFRRFSITICMVQSFVYLVLVMLLKNNVYLLSAVMGDIAVAVSILVAVLKDKILKTNERRCRYEEV